MEPSVAQIRTPTDPEANAIAETQLIDFLEFCKKENLTNLVFTRFPHRNYVGHIAKVSRVEELLNQYGYSLWNMEGKLDEIGLDINADFYDDEHVNIYGQEKMTEYIGSYLTTEWIDTPVAQSEKNAAHWKDCIEAYKSFHAYACYMTEAGIERWAAEEPYELSFYHEWLENGFLTP